MRKRFEDLKDSAAQELPPSHSHHINADSDLSSLLPARPPLVLDVFLQHFAAAQPGPSNKRAVHITLRQSHRHLGRLSFEMDMCLESGAQGIEERARMVGPVVGCSRKRSPEKTPKAAVKGSVVSVVNGLIARLPFRRVPLIIWERGEPGCR